MGFRLLICHGVGFSEGKRLPGISCLTTASHLSVEYRGCIVYPTLAIASSRSQDAKTVWFSQGAALHAASGLYYCAMDTFEIITKEDVARAVYEAIPPDSVRTAE